MRFEWHTIEGEVVERRAGELEQLGEVLVRAHGGNDDANAIEGDDKLTARYDNN